MPTQTNYGPKSSYKTPDPNKATVSHAQSNFDGGATTKKGGSSKGRQMNYGDTSSGGDKPPRSYFGEKGGTGCNGGY